MFLSLSNLSHVTIPVFLSNTLNGQCIHWPVKVFDKKTGMVTWKRFDKDGSLQVKKFYVPELHDPEFKLPPGYNPQPPAGAADDVLGLGNPEPDRKRRRYADGQDRSMEAEKK